MNFEELKSRDIKDLRILAAQYGIKTHHKAKAETVAKLIIEFIQNKPKASTESLKHTAEQPKAPDVVHTEDEIRHILAHLVNKDGYLITFPGDDTVIFKYRGAEESIHLSTSLRWIKVKADNVARGAILPRAIKSALHGGTSDLVMMI